MARAKKHIDIDDVDTKAEEVTEVSGVDAPENSSAGMSEPDLGDESAQTVECDQVKDSEKSDHGAQAEDDKEKAQGQKTDLEPADDEKLAKAKAKAAEMHDRYLRLQAEWDNFRKRTASERDSERTRAAEQLVTDLLPLLDDIERAIKHAKETGEGGTLVEGIEAIQTKFLQILAKHHVKLVEAEGKPFDANCHQAVGTMDDDSVPEETVVQVYQQGYMMGEKVIRPAMVVTSTGGPTQTTQD